MWETICDSWACWSGWKFGPNSAVYPYSAIQNTPPPPGNENCQKSWHFDFSVAEYPPPPPRKWQLSEILPLWLSVAEYPPPPAPPPGNENCQKSWHFDFSVAEYPPPPRKLKLRQILELCDFSTVDYPPPKKLKLRQILELCDFSSADYPPPPPENWNLGRSWNFVIFQVQITPPKIETYADLGTLWFFKCRLPPPPKIET